MALLRAQVEPTPTAGMDLHDAALEIGLAVNHSTYDTLYLAFAIAVGARGVAVALGRDAHADAAPAPMLARLVAVVALVAYHRERLQPCRQRLGLRAVALLAQRGQLPADEAQAIDGVVGLGGQPPAAAPDAFVPAAAGAGRGPVALDAGAVDVQHVRRGHRLRALHQPVKNAPLGPAAEPLLGRVGRRHKAAKLGPGQVGSHHNEAGADEAAQAVQVATVHIRHRLQGGEHALPHRVLNEMLFHARASIVPRNTMMARVGHGANQPRGHLPRQNFVPSTARRNSPLRSM